MTKFNPALAALFARGGYIFDRLQRPGPETQTELVTDRVELEGQAAGPEH